MNLETALVRPGGVPCAPGTVCGVLLHQVVVVVVVVVVFVVVVSLRPLARRSRSALEVPHGGREGRHPSHPRGPPPGSGRLSRIDGGAAP